MEDAPVVAPTMVANLRSVTVWMSSSTDARTVETTDAAPGTATANAAATRGRSTGAARRGCVPSIVSEDKQVADTAGAWKTRHVVVDDLSYISEAGPQESEAAAHNWRKSRRRSSGLACCDHASELRLAHGRRQWELQPRGGRHKTHRGCVGTCQSACRRADDLVDCSIRPRMYGWGTMGGSGGVAASPVRAQSENWSKKDGERR